MTIVGTGRDQASKEAFGNLLRLHRLESGLSVLGVQTALHGHGKPVSEQAWRNWEKGRALPPLTLLPTMAAILNCDVQDLVPSV